MSIPKIAAAAMCASLCVLMADCSLAAPARRPARIPNHVTVHRDVHVHRTVVVRPVRPWVVRPYYGAVIAGVTLGTIVVASTVPPAPAPTLCWYWADANQTQGYWDYCKTPK
jgi:hypothetical protein